MKVSPGTMYAKLLPPIAPVADKIKPVLIFTIAGTVEKHVGKLLAVWNVMFKKPEK